LRRKASVSKRPGRNAIKTSILALATGVALACPTTTYANENCNLFEELFFGSNFSHRAREETPGQQSRDPFIPRRTDGLSSNIDACASYGCVGVGGD
jgi:hypothetical protein